MDNQFKRVSSNPRPDAYHPKTETKFETPEETATRDQVQTTASPLLAVRPEDIKEREVAKKKRFNKLSWPPNKKQWLAIGGIVLIVLVGGYGVYHYVVAKPVKKQLVLAAKKPAPPDTVASTLTGLQVSPDTNKLPLTAVMIENSDQARPQSGLGEAGVVFEAVAEGGVTRFMAVFQSNASTSLGPIRSARPYYVAWALGFDAAYAHVGGSPDALSDIGAWGVKNMDQFANGSYYQRVSSRPAPHNVYTTLAKLNQLEQAKGYGTSSFTSWPRKPESPLKTPTASSINLTLSGPDYDAAYTYNPKTNSYSRNEAGSPQIDADTNSQLSPKVVIAIVVPESNGALDASGAYYSDYSFIGSGSAYVFQDGGVTQGQWSKTANNSQIDFTDASGSPIIFDPGQVWITAVSSSSGVSYK